MPQKINKELGVLDRIVGAKTAYSWLNHRNLYLLGLAAVICGLGWSNALMSIGQLILLGNWLLELNFTQKWAKIKSNKIFWVLLSFFILQIVGFFWTEDLTYAIKDSKVKLPLLMLPVVIGTTAKISTREWKILLKVYLITLLLLTFASLYKFLGFSESEILDKRQLSNYISHIRYGLNLAFAAILAVRFRKFIFAKSGVIAVLLAVWFVCCLVLFQLYSGLIYGLVAAVVLLFYYLIFNKVHLAFRLGSVAILLTIVVGAIMITSSVYRSYKGNIKIDYDQTAIPYQPAPSGENYWHEYESTQKENGVYVRRFIAWKELEKEWGKRSEISIYDKDYKENQLYSTLNRFLSSKGLKKDSAGVSKLTDEEVKAIEKGIANTYYLSHNALENRLHNTMYEMDRYEETGNASGYSFAMRLEFWKTAWHIIKRNKWTGVGTGDVKTEFEQQYELDNSKLDKSFRKRAHNQYLTFMVAFGFGGILFFLLYLLVPLFLIENNFKMYLVFLILAALSFLTEDTLETQAGVTFFALFNCLFLLGFERLQESTSK